MRLDRFLQPKGDERENYYLALASRAGFISAIIISIMLATVFGLVGRPGMATYIIIPTFLGILIQDILLIRWKAIDKESARNIVGYLISYFPIILYIFLMVSAIVFSEYVLQGKPYGIFITIGIAITGIAAIVYWHSRKFAYKCANCGETFTITFWQDFLSPHYPNKKYLKCSKCGNRMWAEEVKEKKYKNYT
jgi:DNA-directed RNA polymerase subunit RPC12/RpoP